MERKDEERRLALMERDQMVPILSTYKGKRGLETGGWKYTHIQLGALEW